MALHTHYDNLKIARNAPPEVVRAAYRVLAQKYHPDRYANQAEGARILSCINDAYRILIDPAQRREHDQWIKQKESTAARKESSPSAAHAQRWQGSTSGAWSASADAATGAWTANNRDSATHAGRASASGRARGANSAGGSGKAGHTDGTSGSTNSSNTGSTNRPSKPGNPGTASARTAPSARTQYARSASSTQGATPRAYSRSTARANAQNCSTVEARTAASAGYGARFEARGAAGACLGAEDGFEYAERRRSGDVSMLRRVVGIPLVVLCVSAIVVGAVSLYEQVSTTERKYIPYQPASHTFSLPESATTSMIGATAVSFSDLPGAANK